VRTIIAARRTLAHTTVMTTMSRLAEKGLLRREGQGRGKRIMYAPAMSEQAFVATRLADILGNVARDYPVVLAQALVKRLPVTAR
jgi:predicted transcriptional regulator